MKVESDRPLKHQASYENGRARKTNRYKMGLPQIKFLFQKGICCDDAELREAEHIVVIDALRRPYEAINVWNR